MTTTLRSVGVVCCVPHSGSPGATRAHRDPDESRRDPRHGPGRVRRDREHRHRASVARIECDTVVLTGDWIPDHELVRLGGIDAGRRHPRARRGHRVEHQYARSLRDRQPHAPGRHRRRRGARWRPCRRSCHRLARSSWRARRSVFGCRQQRRFGLGGATADPPSWPAAGARASAAVERRVSQRTCRRGPSSWPRDRPSSAAVARCPWSGLPRSVLDRQRCRPARWRHRA